MFGSFLGSSLYTKDIDRATRSPKSKDWILVFLFHSVVSLSLVLTLKHVEELGRYQGHGTPKLYYMVI